MGLHRYQRLRPKLGLTREQKRNFGATTDVTHDLPVVRILHQGLNSGAPISACAVLPISLLVRIGSIWLA
jgi:hypothetical protein